MNLLNRVQLFHGDATPAQALIYARLEDMGVKCGCSLSGQLVGPLRTDARTLPASISFVPCDPGDSLLAHAVLPDPCYWSMATPALYRAELEFHNNDGNITRAQLLTGFRGLGTRGSHLFRHGKPWVIRGVKLSQTPDTDWGTWRRLAAAMITDAPGEELCRRASNTGVALLVNLPNDAQQRDQMLQRISNWPAVAVVYAESGTAGMATMPSRFPNLIFGEFFRAGQVVEPAPWTHVVICEVGEIEAFQQHISTCSCPIIAARSTAIVKGLEHARHECDRLQSDLAPTGDFVGYLVYCS